MNATDVAAKIKETDPSWATNVLEAFGEVTVQVRRDSIDAVCRFLRDTAGFDMLVDLCGADNGPEEDPRFVVNYHLLGTQHHQRIRLQVLLSEDDPHVSTVSHIWSTADWHERETWDMFGVVFDGHPDLRRILLPSDFDGHALRKDYPLRGYEPYSLN
ncbi:MAG: NADH-quinone oxidoreductase subunit C [Pyrinomonadaceae bacterium]